MTYQDWRSAVEDHFMLHDSIAAVEAWRTIIKDVTGSAPPVAATYLHLEANWGLISEEDRQRLAPTFKLLFPNT